MRVSRRAVLLGAGAAWGGFAPVPAWPQTFPSRTLKLVVPYPAGGATDILARTTAEALAQRLGQPIVTENMPGANTSVAASAVARAAPDGHTLLVVSGASLVLNPLLYRNLPYDPDRDLRPLAILAEVPLVLVVNPAVPARTLSEFVTYARQEGDRLNYASVGIGNPLHLAAELFKRASGARMTHVPYRGSAPALSDLMAGQVQAMFDVASSSLPQIQGGTLRALAVTTAQRLPQLPDVPTIAESGYPNYRASVWFGVAVTRRTPDDAARKIADALADIQRDPAYRARLETVSYIVQPPRDAAAIASFLADETARWREVIRAESISLD